MNASENVLSALLEAGATPIETEMLAVRPTDVLITPRLASRAAKPADGEREGIALREIAALTRADPQRAVKRLLDWTVGLCDAGSAGLSLLEAGPDGAPWFAWDTLSGPLDIHTNGGAPRHFSPCGLCLDAGRTILVERPALAFDYLNAAAEPMWEGLLTPLYAPDGPALGTLWVVHHDAAKHFDAEDARVVERLAALLVPALIARRTARNAAEATPAPSDNPFVRKLAGFVRLSEADEKLLEQVSANAIPVGARVDLIRRSDPTGGVFVIMEGMACRYRQLDTGRRQITAFMLPGDSCDLDVALLSRMDHAIMTLAPSRVIRIPQETVRDLVGRHGTIATALRKTTLVDEATLREWLVNIGSRPALERIAHLLCELQVRLEVVGLATGDQYEFPVTQVDLAETTGLSNVHVNRTLQELRRRGLITLAGKTLTIHDRAALRELAGFRADYLHVDRTAVPD